MQWNKEWKTNNLAQLDLQTRYHMLSFILRHIHLHTREVALQAGSMLVGLTTAVAASAWSLISPWESAREADEARAWVQCLLTGVKFPGHSSSDLVCTKTFECSSCNQRRGNRHTSTGIADSMMPSKPRCIWVFRFIISWLPCNLVYIRVTRSYALVVSCNMRCLGAI